MLEFCMRTDVLRAKLHLKRKLLSVVGFKPHSYVSLHNLESETHLEKIFLRNYSEPYYSEGQDKRNSRKQGHYFTERNVYEIKNVIVEPKQGILFSKDGKFILESSSWHRLHQYISFPWNPKKVNRVLSVDKGIVLSSNPYGHWLIEDLATTIEAMNVDQNAPLLVAKNHPKYVSDFLTTTSRKVYLLDGPTLVSSVILVEKGQDSGWVHSSDLKTLLNYRPFELARKTQVAKKRIYATRLGLKRSPENENEIVALFQRFGFSIIDLASLNLLDEISLIANSEVLAGVHGSTFVNQIWMRESSIALEIVNRNYWTEMDLDQYLGLGVQKEIYSYIGGYNDAVPLEPLRQKLRTLFAK